MRADKSNIHLNIKMISDGNSIDIVQMLCVRDEKHQRSWDFLTWESVFWDRSMKSWRESKQKGKGKREGESERARKKERERETELAKGRKSEQEPRKNLVPYLPFVSCNFHLFTHFEM